MNFSPFKKNKQANLDSRSLKSSHDFLSFREGNDVFENSFLEIPPLRNTMWKNFFGRVMHGKAMEDKGGPRVVPLGLLPTQWSPQGYESNALNNRQYSVFTFLPLSLYHQFKNFFNLFYLLLAISQSIPSLRVGFMITYLAPLALTVSLSLLKEAADELRRFLRDFAINREPFTKLERGGQLVSIPASSIKVGDLLVLQRNQRIPADCVLLHTTESSGTTFVRTDQLDGETDWKLRYPLNSTKRLTYEQISVLRANLRVEALHKDIYKFVGAMDTRWNYSTEETSEVISLENTLWTSCVVASGTILGAVIHTGHETKSAMNSSKPRAKSGLIEKELNKIGILCFLLMVVAAVGLTAQQGFRGKWVIMIIRFLVLISAMVPISMRVNIDVGRLWYSFDISRDAQIPGTIARNSDLPEELGRIQYLFSDKTGTLTKNKMKFRKMQCSAETVLKDTALERISALVREYFSNEQYWYGSGDQGEIPAMHHQNFHLREVLAVGEMLKSIILAHSVSPIASSDTWKAGEPMEYQASSPDEVALVQFCATLNVHLIERSLTSMAFLDPFGRRHEVQIVKTFPFTSERKCMGIIVKERVDFSSSRDASKSLNNHFIPNPSFLLSSNAELLSHSIPPLSKRAGDNTNWNSPTSPEDNGATNMPHNVGEDNSRRATPCPPIFPSSLHSDPSGPTRFSSFGTSLVTPPPPPLPSYHYTYYMKGADTKMATVIQYSDWMEECCSEMAMDGLRTLLFGYRPLSEVEVEQFLEGYNRATCIIGEERNDAIAAAMTVIEQHLTLAGVTGVEDELQDDVVITLETLGMCGIKVWLLTGDKIETATCIGRSTRLIPRRAELVHLDATSPFDARAQLEHLAFTYTRRNPFEWKESNSAGMKEGFERRSLSGSWFPFGFMGILSRIYHRREGISSSLDYFNVPPSSSSSNPWTLILGGDTLAHCLHPDVCPLFVSVARQAYSLIIARCSPTQKAQVVQKMRMCSPPSVRMAAIGDGGNDVAMILAANVGIGVEGVEGKQASLAADFSITQFSNCLRLIMWHGRNAYRRTCRLSQFIMHRGIVFAVVQATFSVMFAGTTMSVFNDFLRMGYSTVFTMAPAFALVLDEDFEEKRIQEYPQLYKELLKSRSLNLRSFLEWIWISLFQGGVMMYLCLEIFSSEMLQIVTIAFTSLLLTEFIIVGATAHLHILWKQKRFHFWLFIASLTLSLVIFLVVGGTLPNTFDREFFFSGSCWSRISLVCFLSIGPLFFFPPLAHRFMKSFTGSQWLR